MPPAEQGLSQNQGVCVRRQAFCPVNDNEISRCYLRDTSSSRGCGKSGNHARFPNSFLLSPRQTTSSPACPHQNGNGIGTGHLPLRHIQMERNHHLLNEGFSRSCQVVMILVEISPLHLLKARKSERPSLCDLTLVIWLDCY
jgi:hypothetical protein